jgi:SepF-like predicted cell division protein (DUF552 family)
MVLNKIKEILFGLKKEADEDDYLEIDLEKEKKEQKALIKLFILKSYEDVNEVINSLREGKTIGIIDIGKLKKKDPIELKRAVSKIKKTTDVVSGNIAGFGDNIIVTPAFVKIHKEVIGSMKKIKK